MLFTLQRERGCFPEKPVLWRAEIRERDLVYVPTRCSLNPLKKLEQPARFCCLSACHLQEIASWEFS